MILGKLKFEYLSLKTGLNPLSAILRLHIEGSRLGFDANDFYDQIRG